jgi:hypothetical protein
VAEGAAEKKEKGENCRLEKGKTGGRLFFGQLGTQISSFSDHETGGREKIEPLNWLGRILTVGSK